MNYKYIHIIHLCKIGVMIMRFKQKETKQWKCLFASQSRAVLGLKFSLLIAHSHFFLLSAFLSPEGMLYILYPSQERLLHPNAQQNTISNRKSVNTLLILLVWKKLVGTKMAAISHVTRFSMQRSEDNRCPNSSGDQVLILRREENRRTRKKTPQSTEEIDNSTHI